MSWTIEARTNRTAPGKARASVHIKFEDESGITISNIAVIEEDKKLKIKLPSSAYSGDRRPTVTLQGALKQDVAEAVAKEYRASKV